MKQISDDVSRKFFSLSFLFACMVVFIHTPSSRTPGIVFIKDYFPGCFQDSANAWFFFVAGYFMANHFGKTGWWFESARKRVKTLIVPYCAINFTWMAIVALYQWPNFHYPLDQMVTPFRFFLNAMGVSFCAPIDSPLWFVRSLISFVAILPLFVVPIRKSLGALILLLALFCFHLYAYCMGWSFDILKPDMLFFYLLGFSCRVHDFNGMGWKIGCAFLVVGMALAIYAPMDGVPRHNRYVDLLAKDFGKLFIIFGAVSAMPAICLPRALTSNAFAVYVFHWPMITISYIFFAKTGFYVTIFGNAILSLIFTVVVIGLSVLLASAIRKSKRLEMIVFGGR